MTPTKSKYSILAQVCKLIPRNLVVALAIKHGVHKKARSFSPWSHVVSLVFAQVSHALSLNDVADTMSAHRGVLSTIRNATPPSRNNLSHANKVRNAAMAEELFWSVMNQLRTENKTFGSGNQYSSIPRKFKKAIYAVDSTTIQLVANCMNWAKHRRRKAAAKCHMNLNLQSFLPHFAIVTTAAHSDAREAREICSTLKDGEIAVFDKAYVDFEHLYELHNRGVCWVSRAKNNMRYKVVGQHTKPKDTIHRDVKIKLLVENSKQAYPDSLRLVEATVIVDGEERRMTFITNNMQWAPSSVCGLYKCRWGIEVFFKQIKQTLQLADFLGQSENAVRWQIWIALLTYVLLRYIAFISKWSGSFSRLFTLLRGTLWSRFDLVNFVKLYGTAQGPPRTIGAPAQAYLPGIL
jgi:hypothetical protein